MCFSAPARGADLLTIFGYKLKSTDCNRKQLVLMITGELKSQVDAVWNAFAGRFATTGATLVQQMLIS